MPNFPAIPERCVKPHSEGMTKMAAHGAVFLRGECR